MMPHLYRTAMASVLLLPSLVFAEPGKIQRLGRSSAGASQAVVVEDVPLVHTGQLSALDVGGNLAGAGQVKTQMAAIMKQLAVVLEAGGSSLDQLVRLHVVAASQDAADAVREQLAAQFKPELRPAVTLVVGTTPRAGILVCLDAVAMSATGKGNRLGFPSSKTVSVAGGAPLAILPAGPVFHVAGQAERGKTLAEQTRKTMASLQATLKQYERDLEDVAQVKAFLDPMSNWQEARKEIEASFGKKTVPPIVFVEWTSANSIEIELTAQAGPSKSAAAIDYLTPVGMTASPLFSRVARINRGRRVYTSGLIGAGKDGAEQVKDIYEQLKGILGVTGSDFRHLAKATYYVSSDDASKQLNALRPNYYDPKRPPSASKAPVRGVGQRASGIVIDMIAVVP